MDVNAIAGSSLLHHFPGITYLSHEFRGFEVSHIHRNGNEPAHLLAKYALGVKYYVTWIEESPYFLKHALSNDVISVHSIQ